MKLIKRKGKWYQFTGIYNNKQQAYRKGYQYRKTYPQKKYLVIPLKTNMYALYTTIK